MAINKKKEKDSYFKMQTGRSIACLCKRFFERPLYSENPYHSKLQLWMSMQMERMARHLSSSGGL